jgi:plastocyanin
MRPVAYVLAAAVLGTGISALLANGTLADAPSPAPSAAAVDVNTKDFAYAPASVTIAVGTKIIFKNSDTVAHTVTAEDKSFDSKNLDQGQTWSHVFDKAGTYKYTCAYHSFMLGTVIVK